MSYRDFWDTPIIAVPEKTGAARVMDCSDIREAIDHLGISLQDKNVLDVGCGTGRVAQLCKKWKGVDISPPMVAYCRSRGLDAEVIDSPEDLSGSFDVVACFSVFTHISPADGREYLNRFKELAPVLLVDIIPGPEGEGGMGLLRRDPELFETDLGSYGIKSRFSRVSPDGAEHLYFYCQ